MQIMELTSADDCGDAVTAAFEICGPPTVVVAMEGFQPGGATIFFSSSMDFRSKQDTRASVTKHYLNRSCIPTTKQDLTFGLSSGWLLW